MTHRQKRSFEFYVLYFCDGALCMFDLFMKINEKNENLPFSKIWLLNLFWALFKVENMFCTPTTR